MHLQKCLTFGVHITCHSTLKDMMSKMSKQEGVTEQLKATNQMLWVQKINNIRNRAEEFIMREYVYGGIFVMTVR